MWFNEEANERGREEKKEWKKNVVPGGGIKSSVPLCVEKVREQARSRLRSCSGAIIRDSGLAYTGTRARVRPSPQNSFAIGSMPRDPSMRAHRGHGESAATREGKPERKREAAGCSRLCEGQGNSSRGHGLFTPDCNDCTLSKVEHERQKDREPSREIKTKRDFFSARSYTHVGLNTLDEFTNRLETLHRSSVIKFTLRIAHFYLPIKLIPTIIINQAIISSTSKFTPSFRTFGTIFIKTSKNSLFFIIHSRPKIQSHFSRLSFDKIEIWKKSQKFVFFFFFLILTNHDLWIFSRGSEKDYWALRILY